MIKNISLVLLEALVVGISLIAIYEIVKMSMGIKERSNFMVLFVSGMVFHLLFEYTGVNQWYSENYCQLLKR